MNIEVGKSYELRGGGLGIVLARVPDPCHEERWLGAIGEDAGWSAALWFDGGKHLKFAASPFDIVRVYERDKTTG